MNKKRIFLNLNRNNSFCVAVIFLSIFIFSSNVLVAQINKPKKKVTENLVLVKGNVVDNTKSAVIGATVMVAGTAHRTVTDIDGNFSLLAPQNAEITVSYIGYVTKKTKFEGKPLNILLEDNTSKLDEVVVVGYGTVKRANLTGSVSSVSMKELTDYPAPNLATVLNGQMAGVQVSEPTGNPIGSASISIRASSSFSGTSNPLIVIDGFIRDINAFNMLDPSEIESISVLKDASAAVYGVRGRDGVVLVTTKRGKVGKPQVSYSASFGVNQGVEMPKMMTAFQQASSLNDMWQQQVTYDGVDPTTINYFSNAELQKLKSVNYNWLDGVWQDSQNMRHTINVSGGTEAVKYFVGGSYMTANGNFKGLGMSRYGIRFGVDANITKDLKGSFSMDYGQKETHSPLNSTDTEYDRMYGTFSELVRTSRWLPPFINGLPANTSGLYNAIELLQSGSYRNSTNSDMTVSMSLVYSVPKINGLKVTFSGNYNRNSSNGKQYSVPYYLYNFQKDSVNTHLYSNNPYPVGSSNYRTLITNGNKIYESANFGYSYQINPQISYANKFGDHDISAILVYEQSEGGGNGLSESRQTLIIPNYQVMDAYSTTSQMTSSNINSLTRRQSFISRINYNYAGKYFIEAAARNDGSTLFANGYRWGFFPTVSLAWRVSEEPFFKPLTSVIDNLKVRGSYGVLGSDAATANQYRYSYQTSGYVFLGGGATNLMLSPKNGGLVYDAATWETTKQFNGGIDMDILNDLSVSMDGYYKRTDNILDTPTSTYPQSNGVVGNIPALNYGIQDAWGAELELRYNKKLTKDFTLQLRGNFTYLMNKVIKKYESPGVVGTWQDENGKVSGGEVGYQCMGIARTQTDVNNYIAYLEADYAKYHNGQTGGVNVLGLNESQMKPGMLMYKDVGSAPYQDANGKWHDGAPDGIIDANDMRIIGKYSFSPYIYNFSAGFTWKSFRFEAMFSGQFGSNAFFEKAFWTDNSGGGRTGAFLSQTSNQLAEWYGNYWTETNVNAIYPRLDANSLRGYRSTFWMRNGSQLQLKTINVSYSLPTLWTKKVGIEQCRVYCQASNIWTIINPYPYKDASVGFWSDYPMVRTINLGLNLTF